MSLSKDGKTIAAAGYDTLYFGDVKAGRLTELRLRNVESRTCVALSPDGKVVAAQNATGTVGLWARPSGKLLRECRGHKGKINCAAFSPDGKTLASCGEDGTIRFWDVMSGKETLRLNREKAVSTVAFSGDGETLASCGEDGKLCLWRLPEGKLLRELGEGRGGLGFKTVAFSPDGKTVAASGGGQMVHRWDLTTLKPLRRLATNPAVIAFSPDGTTLATGGHDSTIRLWDAATGKERALLTDGHGSSVSAVAACVDGTVATCGEDCIRLWDPTISRELRQFKSNMSARPCMAVSPDGKFIASPYCLWDRATGKEVGRFKERVWMQNSNIVAMAFGPDSRTLAMAENPYEPSKDRKMIRLWDVAALKEMKDFGTQSVCSLSYAPDGKTLAAGNANGAVCLWDVATSREAWRIRGHKARGELDRLFPRQQGRGLEELRWRPLPLGRGHREATPAARPRARHGTLGAHAGGDLRPERGKCWHPPNGLAITKGKSRYGKRQRGRFGHGSWGIKALSTPSPSRGTAGP